MLTRLTVVFGAVILMLSARQVHAEDTPEHGYSREHTVSISDVVQVGGDDSAEDAAGSSEVRVAGFDGGVVAPDPCIYRPLAPQPGADDPLWGGHDPDAGEMWQAWCPDVLDTDSADSGFGGAFSVIPGMPYFVGAGESPAEGMVAVDPMALVVRASAMVTMPRPEPAFGPVAGELAVKIPVWFSVPAYAPQVATATAGRFTATVTSELASTVWEPGEPVDAYDRWSPPAPAVECAGGGAPYVAGANPDEPPCGYTYVWRSLNERTDGLGRWLLTVTSNYTVTYSVVDSSTGATVRAGTDAEQVATRVLMPIREWHAVLGSGAGPAPANEQIYPEILDD